MLRFCSWFALGSECGTQQGKKDSILAGKQSLLASEEIMPEQWFFRCSKKLSILKAFSNLKGSMILQKDASGDAASKAFCYLEKKPSEKSDLLEFEHSVLEVVLTTNVFPKWFFTLFFFFPSRKYSRYKVRIMSENEECLLVNPELRDLIFAQKDGYI